MAYTTEIRAALGENRGGDQTSGDGNTGRSDQEEREVVVRGIPGIC